MPEPWMSTWIKLASDLYSILTAPMMVLASH
jgi:hypothetical protein